MKIVLEERPKPLGKGTISNGRLKLPVSLNHHGELLWNEKTPKSLRKGSMAIEQRKFWNEIRDACIKNGEDFHWTTRSNDLHLSVEQIDQIIARFA